MTQEILQVLGNNPLAQGINQAGPDIMDALAKRAAMRKQTQQVAQLAQATGDTSPIGEDITPDQYEKIRTIKQAQQDRALKIAEARAKLELEVEKMRKGYVETDPATGKTTRYGVQGLKVSSDENGYPIIARDDSYSPANVPKSTGGGASQRGSTQQTTYADSADGTPLFFDRDSQRYIRSDGQSIKGQPVPAKGNADVVEKASRAAVMLPKIDALFDSLNKTASAKLAVAPGIGPIFYPEINQLKNEALQSGFSFAGKNFTGNEKQIIVGAMIPTMADNYDSREAKRKALKGYLSGQIDLAQAANLIGPSGEAIKKVIASGKGGLSPEKQARLEYLRKKKAEGTLR